MYINIFYININKNEDSLLIDVHCLTIYYTICMNPDIRYLA